MHGTGNNFTNRIAVFAKMLGIMPKLNLKNVTLYWADTVDLDRQLKAIRFGKRKDRRYRKADIMRLIKKYDYYKKRS